MFTKYHSEIAIENRALFGQMAFVDEKGMPAKSYLCLVKAQVYGCGKSCQKGLKKRTCLLQKMLTKVIQITGGPDGV